MPAKDRKDVLIDFPAKLILIEGRNGLGYPRVQPKIRDYVISHSVTPQGGFHARAFDNGVPVKDFGILPESHLRYVSLQPGAIIRVPSPESAATASLAPTDYDTFRGLVAFRDKQTGDLLIRAESQGQVTVVFWEKMRGPHHYKSLEFSSRER